MNTTGKLRSIDLAGSALDEVISMDHQYFPNPWTEQQWRDLNPALNLLLVWQPQDKCQGFALFGAVPGDNSAHLYKILLHPDCRGTGMAQEFWQASCLFLKANGIISVYLEVEADNAPAITFYQKVGYKLLRKSKGYYSNGQDALIMELTL